MVSNCGRYIIMSRIRTLFLPLMNLMEYKTALNAVIFGNLTSRNGTAVKVNFSESQNIMETIPRNTALSATKVSLASSCPCMSVKAVIPQKTAGARARSPITLVHRAAEMLRLKVHFLNSTRENGSWRFCGTSDVMP